jgi:hypothetical protein
VRADPSRDPACHLRVQEVELTHTELTQALPPRGPDVDRREAQHAEDGMGSRRRDHSATLASSSSASAIIPQSARYAIRRSSR